MGRGLGAQERKLLERARREGLTPVLPDDMDAFSSEASSIRRAARRLQDKGLIRLSLFGRNRRNGKKQQWLRPRGCAAYGARALAYGATAGMAVPSRVFP